jgi:hypothetical protein
MISIASAATKEIKFILLMMYIGHGTSHSYGEVMRELMSILSLRNDINCCIRVLLERQLTTSDDKHGGINFWRGI